jgi:hypothetical protein
MILDSKNFSLNLDNLPPRKDKILCSISCGYENPFSIDALSTKHHSLLYRGTLIQPTEFNRDGLDSLQKLWTARLSSLGDITQKLLLPKDIAEKIANTPFAMLTFMWWHTRNASPVPLSYWKIHPVPIRHLIEHFFFHGRIAENMKKDVTGAKTST